MIGISEGNGHPFSFSAIINGFSESGLANSGWKVIYDYVRQRDASEFGIDNLKVTHAWTQDKGQTERLCEACLIPHAVEEIRGLIGQVDAVIIARDDYESHFDMAMPFLEAGLSVFVDKPLSLDLSQLKTLRPYMETGQLMSCSGMYYARELDEVRSTLDAYGKLKLIRGAVLNSWEKYGVHAIYAVLGVLDVRAVWVEAIEASHFSSAIALENGCLLQIDALGSVPKTFSIDIWGEDARSTHEIGDNFSMFRRMLWHFGQAVREKRPMLNPRVTLDAMRILMAGRISKGQKRRVFLNEVEL